VDRAAPHGKARRLMRVVIAAVGRLKSGPERDLVARYLERASVGARALGWRGPDLIEIPESKARRPEDRKAEEASALRAAIPAGARLVTLDERGDILDSETFARRLQAFRAAATPALAFVIGGADGLDPALRADLSFAFGKATLPHQFVRALVCEQIYRATTILTGHPYHRA
jgi:23S rRNA (pseudouridine1915-N3)-methyltransferase